MKAQLCTCYNCNAVMVDENPADQPLIAIPINIQDMEFVNDSYGGFWACPNCHTDDFLQDVVN